jgi:hypothetical protein
MRRILSLLAMAAMMAMMALTAAPALAQDLPPPGEETPGDPQTPTENPAQPTEQQGENCYGAGASNFVKGPGGNPGSAAEPTEFQGEPAFNGPVTSGAAQSEPEEFGFESDKPNAISAVQESNREASASCGDTGQPS